MNADHPYAFHYRATCQAKGCDHPADYKVAAPWSDGTSCELKNYGTFCEGHAGEALDRARQRQRGLHLAEGETVGTIRLYRLVDGHRDAELQPLADRA